MPSRTIRIRVTPRASAARIVEETGEDGQPVLKIHVTEVPEKGKANKAVIAALANHFGVPKSAIAITRGTTGRDKLVTIST